MGVDYAAYNGLLVASNEHAVAFAGFGHRYPTLKMYSFRSGSQHTIQFLNTGRFFQFNSQINQRTVRGGDPHCHTVKFAFQGGNNLAHSLDRVGRAHV